MVSIDEEGQFIEREKQRRFWAGLLLMVMALLLYAMTMDNGLQPEELVGGDLITHQYAQVQARPSNAPGYPLYTMGGWLWFHTGRLLLHQLGVDLPNPLLILSSYSTIWAVLALWFLYRILSFVTASRQQPAGAWPIALLLTAFYSVTYFFWYYATTTEQYSSAIAQTLAIVYLYLRWQQHLAMPAVAAPTNPTPANRLLVLLALLCGVSLAHMLTVAFIVPPLVIVILWQAPHLLRNGRVLGRTVGAALLPLVSYFYVYGQGSSHPEWWGQGDWATGQAWFWAFVSTAQGRTELGWGFEPWCTAWANDFPALIGNELSWPVVALGLTGIALLRHKLAPLLYGTLAIYLGFAWFYRCGNWFQVILPAYPLLLIGVAPLLTSIHTRRVTTDRPTAQPMNRKAAWYRQSVLYGLLIGAILVRGLLSWPQADSFNRTADSALDRAALQLAAAPPRGSYLFATVEDALALQYLNQIWQIRPDLAVVSSPAAAQQLAAGNAVYSTWEASTTLQNELPARLPSGLLYTPLALDPQWIRFQPAGLSTPDIRLAHQLDRPLTPELLLHGYTLAQAPVSPLAAYRPAIRDAGAGVAVTLAWQLAPGTTWPEGLSISVRLTQQGIPVPNAQQDRVMPARGLSAPQAGLWLDPYFFNLPQVDDGPDLQSNAQSVGGNPAVDGLMLILYRQVDGGFENVVVVQLP